MKNLLFTTLILIAISCNREKATDTRNLEPKADVNTIQLSNEQAYNAKIKTEIISKNKIDYTLRLYGKTFYSPESLTTITSAYGGLIYSLPVIQGQYISKGQTVAVLEDPKFIDIQQDYLLTKSKLKMVQLDYERQKDLNQYKANSDKVYQQSENEYHTNKILLKALSEKLQLLGINPLLLNENNISKRVVVRTKSSGYVSNIYTNKGKYLLPSENILDIINQSNPLLKLKLYEKDMNRIYPGQVLTAHITNNLFKKYTCKVRSINPSIASDGSFEAICSFLQNPKNIFQNTNFIVDLELSSDMLNSLPESAVVNYEGQNYLFIETGKNQFKMTPILAGKSSNGFVEIENMENISNKKIVIEGAYTLLMALKNKEE